MGQAGDLRVHSGAQKQGLMRPIKFGKYNLLERISHGGMAEVFRAKTFGAAGFERTVAIKLLLPTVAMDKEFITMLIDEAKIAGQLSHANIAQIFDLGMADGRYYIVQEFVNGKDLRAVLRHLGEREETLSIAQSCHLMLKVCEGLEYAHNKRDSAGRALNLVHRDVSPQNIVVSREGEVKLIDFGIAKAEGRATRTLAGLVKGKFAYMSPEQIRGLPVDRRSDVFACGIVLWELLTGKPLFRRKSEFETLKRARSAEIEPPSTVNAKIPEALDQVVLTALARHVEDRYQTAIELRDSLWDFVRSHGHFYSRNEVAAWMRETFGKAKDDEESPPHKEYSAELKAEGTAQLPGEDAFEGRTIVDPALADRFHGRVETAGDKETTDAEEKGDEGWGSLDDLAKGPNPDRVEMGGEPATDRSEGAVTAERPASRVTATKRSVAPAKPPKPASPRPLGQASLPVDVEEEEEEPTLDRPRPGNTALPPREPSPSDSAAMTHSFRRAGASYGPPRAAGARGGPELRQPTSEVTSPYRARKSAPPAGASPQPPTGGGAMAPMVSPPSGSGSMPPAPAPDPAADSQPFAMPHGSDRIIGGLPRPSPLHSTDKIDRQAGPPPGRRRKSSSGVYLLAAAVLVLLLAGAASLTLMLTSN